MPELPEVETTIRGLQQKVIGKTFFDVWTDFPKMIHLRQDLGGQVKKPKTFEEFKKEIKGRKIEKVWRRGKNILFDLSNGKTLLIHQKLTGHLLVGNWKLEFGIWRPSSKGPLEDPANRFIHLMFWLSEGLMLALSDLRKFAKVELLDKEKLKKELSSLGPEPLDKNFTFETFKEVLKGKKGKIKQVLINQEVIAGVGNIYSDEILFEAKVHPLKRISQLKEKDLKRIYESMKKILKKAITFQGESISDYRTITGEKGGFDEERKVYRREGEKCPRCGTIIERVKLGGRSAHYCPVCQKL